ncbi:ankyrin repeat domain-containing protein [Microbulbifer halophilus]|uniref:Ankyrin repeat domain-containing protein n=1 Tax=Microbulbifer halophilus TaxID=453963 RepID=A0ABW5E9Y1_9GAMM|nr:ankyrin repeat domain-containing protein [Microbulbifer halophilus]MCW8125370.1 ankyrin repeat domain-containing protein [Microbulbifer halophilus]
MLFELNLFTTFTLSHLLIGTCLILALLAVNRLWNLNAELQSWLWTTALAICVLVPFLSLAPATQPGVAATQAAQTSPLQTGTPAPIADKVRTADNAAAVPSAGEAHARALPGRWVKRAATGVYALLSIWLLGAVWRAGALLRSAQRTRWLIKTAIRHSGSRPAAIRCPLLVSDAIDAPMAAGFIKPVILLPEVFTEKFDSGQLAPILLHEWAHIRRRDLWVGALQELVAIVFWWSPLVRLINRRIHVSRELACDLRAARMLGSGKRFAQSLLDCAELMITRRQSVLAMGLFRKKKDLAERINAALKFRNEKKPKWLAIAAACSALAIASLGVAGEYAPRLNLASITDRPAYASGLSRAEGERMMAVVRRGDMQTLREMQSNGLDINTPVLGEGTALIEAVRENNREISEFLIRSGADVNLPALGDGNPMIAAARHNRLELAKLLHQRGADLDAAVPRDGTPLIVAIRSGHQVMVEQLIDWGADVNQSAKWDGSPLIAAAMTGNLEIARQLYQRGADINGVVSTDETPLINAAHHGHFEMVRFLVQNGADVNLGVRADGDEYRTPLNRAGSSQIREYLVAMGAAE